MDKNSAGLLILLRPQGVNSWKIWSECQEFAKESFLEKNLDTFYLAKRLWSR